MGWLLGYAAVGLLLWGWFMTDESGDPTLSFFMSAVWPATLLLFAGYLLGERFR